MTTHPDFWNRIYEEEGTPEWDMAGATPLVNEVLNLALPLGLRPGCELVVPGCGFGHDAFALSAKGFAVSGLDFAPMAIQGALERYGDGLAFFQADWFTTPLGPWDALFDHTCFVAMDPSRREAYVEACANHLRRGGFWMAVLFHDVGQRPGPPHAIQMEEMQSLVESCFEVQHLGKASYSHPRRAGREFLMIATRR